MAVVSGAVQKLLEQPIRPQPAQTWNRTFPSTIVATTFPVKPQPSYGVFLDFDFDCDASKVHFFFGSKMVTSACEPGARLPRPARPKILAGFAESNSTIRHSGSLKC